MSRAGQNVWPFLGYARRTISARTGADIDEQARAIGRRVRYWRLRRGLDRQQFADMVERSVSWLDKIESGERSLLRLPMLERVAAVLCIDSRSLVDDSVARGAAECVDAAEVAAIRSALGRYPALPTMRTGLPPVVSGEVTKQVEYVEHAWLSSHFTVVAKHLPRLLNDAQVWVMTSGEADRVNATRSLVVAYRLASSMLMKFEAHDVAWLAADRAMQAALAVDDTLALARATRSVARAMTSTGQPAEAIEALTAMADRMRAEVASNALELLSLQGMLFLAAAITAASQEDGQLALAMHHEAASAARHLTSRHQTHQTAFGPANVEVHRVSALSRLHDSSRAVEYARDLDERVIHSLPAERQGAYLLDLTEAYANSGRAGEAARTLSAAERVAPEEVHCRPFAHGLIRSVLRSVNGEAGRTVRQLANRAGVTE